MVPGFNPAHPAVHPKLFTTNGTNRLSVICRSRGFRNVLTGLDGTQSGTVNTTLNNAGLGPGINMGAPGACIFPGFSTSAANLQASGVTMAGILYVNSLAFTESSACIINCDNSTTSGNAISVAQTTGVVRWVRVGTGNHDSGLSLVAGNPYFVAVTAGGSAAHFVVVNLRTGVVQVDISRAVTIAQIFTGGFSVGATGDGASNNRPWSNGGIVAAMFSLKFMSVQELLAWADDPWSFWYQPAANYEYEIAAAAAAAGLPWKVAGIGGGLVGRPGRLAG